MDEVRQAIEMRRIAAERRIADWGLRIEDLGLGIADRERDAFLIPLSEVLREDSLDTVEQSGAKDRLILDLPPFLFGGWRSRAAKPPRTSSVVWNRPRQKPGIFLDPWRPIC